MLQIFLKPKSKLPVWIKLHLFRSPFTFPRTSYLYTKWMAADTTEGLKPTPHFNNQDSGLHIAYKYVHVYDHTETWDNYLIPPLHKLSG